MMPLEFLRYLPSTPAPVHFKGLYYDAVPAHRAHGDLAVLAPLRGAAAVHRRARLEVGAELQLGGLGVARLEAELPLPQVQLHLGPVAEAGVGRGRGGGGVHRVAVSGVSQSGGDKLSCSHPIGASSSHDTSDSQCASLIIMENCIT